MCEACYQITFPLKGHTSVAVCIARRDLIDNCDRLCENQTCRGKIGTTIQAKIGGQYKFVDLLIIDSLVSLDIVLSICEVSANLTNAFTPLKTSPLLGIPQKLNFAIVFLLTVIRNGLNRNAYNFLGESWEIAPSSSF